MAKQDNKESKENKSIESKKKADEQVDKKDVTITENTSTGQQNNTTQQDDTKNPKSLKDSTIKKAILGTCILAAVGVTVGVPTGIALSGTQTVNINVMYEQFAQESRDVLAGTVIGLLDKPEKKGYTFLGWYSSPNYTEASRLEDNELVTNGMTIYAKMVKNLNLTLLIDGVDTTYEVVPGTSLGDFLKNSNLKLDKTTEYVAYWQDSQGTTYIDTTELTNDITLEAIYLTKTVDLILNVAGDSQSLELNFGSTITNLPNIPAAEGYELVGWFSDADYTNKLDEDYVLQNGDVLYAFTQEILCDVTFVAPSDTTYDLFKEDSSTFLDTELSDLAYETSFSFKIGNTVDSTFSSTEYYILTANGESIWPNEQGVYNITLKNDTVIEMCGLATLTTTDNINYQVSNITEYTAVKELNIPATYMGNAITSLGAISGVTEEVTENTNLKALYLPSSITQIDFNDLMYCTTLEILDIDAGNSSYIEQDNVIFTLNEDSTTHTAVFGARGITGDINLLPTTTIIADNAFTNCANLSNINFNELTQLTTIGANAFAVSGIQSAIIPESITSIGENAFNACPNLYEVSLPNFDIGASSNRFDFVNFENFGNYAFANCSNLRYVTINCDLREGSFFHNSGTNTEGIIVTYGEDVTLIYPEQFFGTRNNDYNSIPDGIAKVAEVIFNSKNAKISASTGGSAYGSVGFAHGPAVKTFINGYQDLGNGGVILTINSTEILRRFTIPQEDDDESFNYFASFDDIAEDEIELYGKVINGTIALGVSKIFVSESAITELEALGENSEIYDNLYDGVEITKNPNSEREGYVQYDLAIIK